jgi:hypothetical protein
MSHVKKRGLPGQRIFVLVVILSAVAVVFGRTASSFAQSRPLEDETAYAAVMVAVAAALAALGSLRKFFSLDAKQVFRFFAVCIALGALASSFFPCLHIPAIAVTVLLASFSVGIAVTDLVV